MLRQFELCFENNPNGKYYVYANLLGCANKDEFDIQDLFTIDQDGMS